MIFNHSQYIPCLLWKTGEYQAIWRLPALIKKKLTPLIEVPKFEDFDFEKRKKPRTIDQHVEIFKERVVNKWGEMPCFIDAQFIPLDKNMVNGMSPIFFIFDSLVKLGCSPIPVTGLDRDNVYQKEIKNILSKIKISDMCLRITLEHLAKNDFGDKLSFLLKEIGIGPNRIHLIIDLGAPNFLPMDGFIAAIQGTVIQLPNLNDWLTFSIIGTSFPKIFNKGTVTLPRLEWQFYKQLIAVFKKSKVRLPSFGDYAIIPPGDNPDLDWRIISPAAKVKYTIDDGWYITKGESLRKGSPIQYHQMCSELVKLQFYSGPTFSYGDQFIQKCSIDKTVKTRSHTLWVQIGTNHHLAKVLSDIANFHASSKKS